MSSTPPPPGPDENPYTPPAGDLLPPNRAADRRERPLGGALWTNAIVQTVVLVLAALILDGGQALRFCAIASLGYWAGVAVILLRRSRSPESSDSAFVRFGFALLTLVIWLLTPIIWKLTGQA